MLFYKTITPETLELLKKLQNIDVFSELRLVGGTSLALQIGHRKSDDIDLFGKCDFEDLNVMPELNKLGNVVSLKRSKYINVFLINGVKVDIVNYPYNWIDQVIVKDEIALASEKDIAAMKFSAITGRGSRKDFIDLFFLLQKYTLIDIMNFYIQKYPDGAEFLVLRSLSYFKDAELQAMPYMFANVTWDEVRAKIQSEVIRYSKA